MPFKEQEQYAKEQYDALLLRYGELSKKIRNHEKFLRHGSVIDIIDMQRHELHRQLSSLASRMGISEEELSFYLATAEGNLQEFGVEAPLVELPMPSRSYYNYRENSISRQSDSQTPLQKLYVPGQILKPGWHYMGNVTVAHDERSARERWDKSKFHAIIFTYWAWDHGMHIAPPLHTRRLKRMAQLSADFGLNVYECDDQMGHQNYTPTYTFGLEVQQGLVGEVALTMAKNRDKYWLTEDELSDPFKVEYMLHEDANVVRSLMWSSVHSDVRRGIIPTWRNYYDFLRAYKALRIQNSSEGTSKVGSDSPFDELYDSPLFEYAAGIYDQIRQALEAAKVVNPEAYNEMVSIIEEYS